MTTVTLDKTIKLVEIFDYVNLNIVFNSYPLSLLHYKMDEFTSYISLNIGELSRNINLEKLVPELIRNNFLSDQNLQVYNNIVSEKGTKIEKLK
jgi:hypothetical protein